MLKPEKRTCKRTRLIATTIALLLALLAVSTTVVVTAEAEDQAPAKRVDVDSLFGNVTNLGPSVNSSAADYDPSISADGLELYFNSYRPGGKGTGEDSDVWVTKRKTTWDSWGTPVNLGPPVNSPDWEANPDISRDGSTLYFVSIRSGGAGSADLWKVSVDAQLVRNRSFEEDEMILDDPTWSGWCTWAWESGYDSKVEMDATESVDGARSLRIEPRGGTDWYFIVLQDGISLEVGQTYTVSFWAKAAAPRALAVKFKAADDSIDWGLTDCQLTTDWARYSINSAAENALAKLEFHCAATDDTFWLDRVSVYATRE